MGFVPFAVSKKHYMITRIIQETHDTKSFYLIPKDGSKVFDYKPGHFVNCTIVGKEDIGRRSFSIASSPDEKELMLTIKLVGNFTHVLFEMEEGGLIEILGPLGLPYIRDESITDEIVMISGGSGITPFRSLMRYYIVNNIQNPMCLILSNKTKGDIYYKEDLTEFCNKKENLRIVHFITQEDVGESESFCSQKINDDKFKEILIEPENKLYLLCGPPGLITCAIEILTRMNIPMNKIKTESWGNQNNKAK